MDKIIKLVKAALVSRGASPSVAQTMAVANAAAAWEAVKAAGGDRPTGAAAGLKALETFVKGLQF